MNTVVIENELHLHQLIEMLVVDKDTFVDEIVVEMIDIDAFILI